MLLSTVQAEAANGFEGGAATISEATFTPAGSNNGVALTSGNDKVSYAVTPPVGTTKIRVYLKKKASPVNPVLGMFYDGSPNPQYSVIPNIAITTATLHYIETTTLPTPGNWQINLIGQDILVDRIEFWDDNIGSGSITVANKILTQNPITAGTSGNPVTLNTPNTVSCTDSNTRRLTFIGAGITVRKAGVAMVLNDIFSSADVITYDLANNVPTTTGFIVFKYVAIGACGDSNEASVSGNVTGLSSSITISDQTGVVLAGTTGNTVSFDAPVTVNCSDTGNRILTGIEANITVKKNGNAMSASDTFTSGDAITYDIDNTVVTTTGRNLFQYCVVGVCGNSNVAYIKADVTGVASPSINVSNQTLAGANSGTSGNAVSLANPVVTGSCAWAGTRRLTALGVGITMKKNGNDMILTDTWMSTDIITYSINSSVVTTTGYMVFKYVAIGTCGDSPEATVLVNVTKLQASGGGGTYNAQADITPTATQASTNTSSSIISWVIGGVFLAFSAVAGYFLFFRKDKKKKSKAQ